MLCFPIEPLPAREDGLSRGQYVALRGAIAFQIVNDAARRSNAFYRHAVQRALSYELKARYYPALTLLSQYRIVSIRTSGTIGSLNLSANSKEIGYTILMKYREGQPLGILEISITPYTSAGKR
ncbi:hypothetical protein PAAG_11537 [Paracoccidioides lutzii Pb01]|uniref:Uncharacterized protein n=1 Tax=Paracoccidioides lutzii (strain ATCC MYA-826 / Pb01) TaxID=502779 RepID=A0A0A2V1Q5_PARBA|nr:hypothetical protein PAAG_11537 [Paracoccidioides lutzii Pb01]KGQ01691.1 hypothetical protein PAAG_11537 [Paracoccidioides lutzii Pb01]